MKAGRFLTAISLGVMACAGLAHAAGDVDVSADSFELNDAEHKTIFRGNVVAVRPTDTTKADEMIVLSTDQKQSDGTTKSVTQFVDGSGNVNITTKTASITGTSFRLDVQRDKLVVNGNVVLTQGTSVIRGKLLNVDLKTNFLQMSGGRVSGTFVPK